MYQRLEPKERNAMPQRTVMGLLLAASLTSSYLSPLARIVICGVMTESKIQSSLCHVTYAGTKDWNPILLTVLNQSNWITLAQLQTGIIILPCECMMD